MSKRASAVVELRATARKGGAYLYLPFDVPPGVNRVDGELHAAGPAEVGFGLFDQRGAGYQSAGFRGVFGAERSRFFVAADAASESFIPGRIEPGCWTVIVPVYKVATPTELTVIIGLSFGEQALEAPPGPVSAPAPRGPGWYRGDLHVHSTHSSDAWETGGAQTPAAWGVVATVLGLDFLSLTDHNVTTQNRRLGDDAPDGLLLIGGEEMTNYFHGHATLTGIPPGAWLDWRQRPDCLPVADGEGRIESFFEEARRLGAYTAAAHPMHPEQSWRFLDQAERDPAARPDALEVWNGPWTPDDVEAVRRWDRLLSGGWRVWANGGSDSHGLAEGENPLGEPTTVVYAEELSTPGIVAGLKSGRSFVTRSPDGPEVYLAARDALGRSHGVGGSVRGAGGDMVKVRALVLGGGGRDLIVLRNGEPVHRAEITSDQQCVDATLPLEGGGFVRTELVARERSAHPAVQALTNPIFLEEGPPEDEAPTAIPDPFAHA